MLYPRAMETTYQDLPPALQAFHAVETSNHYSGHVTVTHGSALGRMIAKSGGMPTRSGKMPFSFRATRDGEGEVWERDFDGHITRSTQWLHAPGVIAEKVGTSQFLMQPMVDGETLHIPITGLVAFGLPLPRGILKSCDGVEGVTQDGRITFDVHATLLGVGEIIRYQGVLAPVA